METTATTPLTREDKELLTARLGDPLWRMSNLYSIVDKFGKTVPFKPTREQVQILHAYYELGRKRHVILKARRMGFSTLIDVMIFDAVYWGKSLQASIIDQTQADASEKLRSKVRFAHDKLLPQLHEPAIKSNDTSIEFANGSTINAGKLARGGTNQFLHISEWGPIAHSDPARSEEIKTGALPSADQGAIFIESTFKGGKGGHFYEIIKNAMETPDALKTEKDFYFHFFPWYLDPTNSLMGDIRAVPRDIHAYLDAKEGELGVKFTDGQRLFYHVTKKEQGIFMFREYPTTVAEAFMAPVEGSIYGDILSAIRARGQIHDFIWDRSSPVFAVLDIGWSDATAVWLLQVIGRDVHVINYIERRHHTAAQVVKLIADTEIPVSAYFLPWDSRATAASTGVSYKGEFEKAGAVNVEVLPATREMWAGINATRDVMQRCYFHKTNCSLGLAALEAYHAKDSASGGAISKDPVHDWSSHGADSFRYACEAIVLGKLKTKSARIVREVLPALPTFGGDKAAVVDIDMVRERNQARRGARAIDTFKL
jgi:hypothetical protein